MSGSGTKDLTGLMELPPADAPEGSELAVTAPEPVELESFESLSDLPQEDAPAAPLTEEIPAEPSNEAIPAFDFSTDFATEAPALVPEPIAATPMDAARELSDALPIGKPVVSAAFPFSLKITGRLKPEEKDKLLEILSRENMGVREVDLEPQLQAGRILIPRISEYAGVLLVQALRCASVEMSLGPSDQIFSTDETRGNTDHSLHAYATPSYEEQTELTETLSHPAEDLPIATTDTLPGFSNDAGLRALDVIVVSATLHSQVVHAERSTQYQEILEALRREMKYKAHRKGAVGIVRFSATLTPLALPTQYRLQLIGTALGRN